MQITEIKAEGEIILKVEGRVDTNTSPGLQKAVLLAFQKTERVILDLEQVPYLSSAGLRVLLIGQKTAISKGAGFAVKNIQTAVADVLETSGFDNIITIL